MKKDSKSVPTSFEPLMDIYTTYLAGLRGSWSESQLTLDEKWSPIYHSANKLSPMYRSGNNNLHSCSHLWAI